MVYGEDMIDEQVLQEEYQQVILEAESDQSRQRVYVDGIDLAALATTVIEDAVRILRKGDPAEWDNWAKTRTIDGSSKADAVEAYREAVYWFFYDLDPEGERAFSLQWCCDVLEPLTGAHISADQIRETAARAGLMPKSKPVLPGR